MAVRLHRPSAPALLTVYPEPAVVPAEPAPKERGTQERRIAPVTAASKASPVPRGSGPVLAFPTAPSVRLEIPRPVDERNWRDYLLLAGGVLLAGAVLCALFFGGRQAFTTHEVVLDGVVVEKTRTLTAAIPGRVHRLAAPGEHLEAGAVLATIAQPVLEPPPPVETRAVKRMEESLRRAELALAQARMEQAAIEELRRQERATHDESEEAAQEVQSKQMARDRAADTLARATARPEVKAHPPQPVLADAALVVRSMDIEEGAPVAAGQPIATVASPETRVEAPLAAISAPEEGATVMLQVAGAQLAGRLEGTRVEGATHIISVVFLSPAVIPGGTHIPVRILKPVAAPGS